jgi:hypothetical protein
LGVSGVADVVETMLSRTGRLAVLLGRNAELKDSTSRSQIEVRKKECENNTVTGKEFWFQKKDCGWGGE